MSVIQQTGGGLPIGVGSGGHYAGMNGHITNQGFGGSSGQVRVDQMKPLTLGQINTFRRE